MHELNICLENSQLNADKIENLTIECNRCNSKQTIKNSIKDMAILQERLKCEGCPNNFQIHKDHFIKKIVYYHDDVIVQCSVDVERGRERQERNREREQNNYVSFFENEIMPNLESRDMNQED